ncbi:MAG: glycosyltransferase [Candidatus Omnitrophota bacterium]|nr:MAG: glycosyltransferase [Candidatus Omnitrophota bacterium]
MKRPFFSIIIPTYNRMRFLQIAIDSVLRQEFKDFELIVVDDGSTDSTKELIADLKDSRLYYSYQPHQGVSTARNKGLRNCQGEFICFLDSDDRFRKDKLSLSYNYIKKYPEYKIFHTNEIWYRSGALLAQKTYHQKPSGFVFEQAVKLCCISISTAAIRRGIFDEIGLFDENFPACEDYDFWLRATARYPVMLIPEDLTIKEGGHPDQQSKKYPAMDKFRITALKKILANGELNKELAQIAFEELKEKCSIYIKGALKRKKTKEAQYYKGLIEQFDYV